MPTTTSTDQKIDIPYPDESELDLLLRLGPCRLSLRPSDGPAWVHGTYEDAGGMLPLEIHAGRRTTISQRFDPAFFNGQVLPRLDLEVGRARPFALELQAGASDMAFDLGGLPLTRLTVKAGAGRFEIDFSKPNPVTMTLFELSAGAGTLAARHLANANFAALHYGGGVSACVLDFAGALTRDAAVRIDAGLGSVDISVPADTALRLRSKSFAAGVRMGGQFAKRDDSYITPAAGRDAKPVIDVEASLAFGALNLTTM